MFPILQAAEIDSKLGVLLEKRSSIAHPELEAAVVSAFDALEQDGEKAIVDYTRRFDSETFCEEGIYLTDAFVESCVNGLEPDLRAAIDLAIKNISTVNAHIMSTLIDWTSELAPGHLVGERCLPQDSAMLWVPSRKAPLVSTAIMLCAAAATAEVKNIILATPPLADGFPDRNTVAAAYLAGARHFVCGNGLAIIAAASVGNWRHGRMNAIYGPGPQAIALAMHHGAKYGVATRPGIGPSDSLVIFENSEEDGYFDRLARNFLTEIEHGPDSFTYALTTSATAAKQLQNALKDTSDLQYGRNDHYASIAETAHGGVLVFADIDALVAFANRFSSEHLMINVTGNDRDYVLGNVVSSELLDGQFTPFAAANYCIGITAVLPTNGFARSCSGITSRDFIRFATYARLERQALSNLLPAIEAIGAVERLPNHVEAVRQSVGRCPERVAQN
ncbi:hypothetical protein HGO34_21100 [Agrobacterium vitis]|uniref:Histidinol dehydrogenase n=1 Tax=Agrobacterium vitis TaxID=373 RepID=A0AAE4WEF4_AGRVI|nr:histidinol dehydrogenase [Agrobacterium vitis]MCF1500086.1 hypothetical protein [Allorhizobium sp. Av2]MCM2442229.1 hypothetical protein [Agrobacterium vitis]MUZ58639.1 hypothetical protein [Agrobacterium vitis]MVA66274.1 hypothetical protein [Agrobacterium vitis]MVA88311.1 hypothetical protein [Agrobacterium vitis]